MTDWLRQFVVEPVAIRGVGRLLMLVPLVMSVSLVYKTIRCADLKRVPWAATKLCVLIVGGMMAIGVALLVTFRVLA